MLPNYHILKVSYKGATDTKPSKIRIQSERFKQTILIPYNHSFSNTLEGAEDWLTKNGFTLTGHAEGSNCYYAISSTFKPLKGE